MHIRKVIRQIIQEEINNSVDTDKIFQRFVFLADFDLMSHKSQHGESQWKFSHDIQSNKTIVTITQDINGWTLDYDIIGKIRDQNSDFKIGPFPTFDELVQHANEKINNNLLLMVANNDDDVNVTNEKFLKDMIEKMLEKREDIMNIDNNHLKDLKRLCTSVEKALKTKSMDQLIPMLYTKNKDIMGINNILNKIDSLDFYKSFEKFGKEN